MYRFLSFILSLFILSLAILPCSDHIEIYELDIPGSVQTNHFSSDAAEHHYCSPFCACNCCKTLSVSSFTYVEVPTDNSSPFIISYSSFEKQSLQKAIFDIWQPPQLV